MTVDCHVYNSVILLSLLGQSCCFLMWWWAVTVSSFHHMTQGGLTPCIHMLRHGFESCWHWLMLPQRIWTLISQLSFSTSTHMCIISSVPQKMWKIGFSHAELYKIIVEDNIECLSKWRHFLLYIFNINGLKLLSWAFIFSGEEY